MKKQINNNFNVAENKKRIYSVDLLRILLALMIVCYHTFQYNEIPPYIETLGPGYIAVELFFIISGFFLAKTALKKDAPIWYRWTWRKIWSILPLFILAILFTVVIFSVNCLVYMKLDTWPLTEIFVISWFIWFLVGYGGFIYLFVNKGKEKFGFCAIIIAVACYLGTFFLCGSVNDPKILVDGLDPINVLIKFGMNSFRTIGGLCLGIFIYTCSRFIFLKRKLGIKVILSIFAILCCIAGITLNFIWPSSYWDYLEVFLFFNFLFIVFCNLGAISNKITLSNEASIDIKEMSLCLYFMQGAWIGVMLAIGKNQPELYNQQWYIATYVVCVFVGVVLFAFLLKLLYLPVKTKLLPKFKRLNKI